MARLVEFIGGVALIKAVAAVVFWIVALMFLWQGYKLFRELRVRLAAMLVCTRCGREVLIPNAKFCGKCGGQLSRAA
jgi:ribosomal protein L40E